MKSFRGRAYGISLKHFNALCTKARDVEIHLNTCKKSTKESMGKTGRLLSATVARVRKPYTTLAHHRRKSRL